MTIVLFHHTCVIQDEEDESVDEKNESWRHCSVDVGAQPSEVISPAKLKELSRVYILKSLKHHRWTRKEENNYQTQRKYEQSSEVKVRIDNTEILP